MFATCVANRNHGRVAQDPCTCMNDIHIPSFSATIATTSPRSTSTSTPSSTTSTPQEFVTVSETGYQAAVAILVILAVVLIVVLVGACLLVLVKKGIAFSSWKDDQPEPAMWVIYICSQTHCKTCLYLQASVCILLCCMFGLLEMKPLMTTSPKWSSLIWKPGAEWIVPPVVLSIVSVASLYFCGVILCSNISGEYDGQYEVAN